MHAYVLMTNHVHLLLTPQKADSIGQLIQHVGRHYVPYMNHRYAKSGTLWEGRHKGCLISSDHYLLACMRYIELNPVRAGMVNHPGDYRWSSYLTNAATGNDALITPHPVYGALANNAEERVRLYRELFSQALEDNQIHAISLSTQTGTPLGNDRFRKQIEEALGRSVGHSSRGRPRGKSTC